MLKLNHQLLLIATLSSFLVISACRKSDITPEIEFPSPSTYELKSVEITDGSYLLNANGNPEQIPHDSFFGQFASPEYMHAALISLLRDSLRFATTIHIESKSKLSLRGISLGIDEDSIRLNYQYSGDSLFLTSDTAALALVVHEDKINKTLHMYICMYQYTSKVSNTLTPSALSMVYIPKINSRESLLSYVIDHHNVKPENYVMVMFADYVYELK